MRIGILQFGDFREAVDLFRTGGEETYSAQKYSVEYVTSLTARADFVGVCSILGQNAYVAEIAPGLISACIPWSDGKINDAEITALLERWELTHLLLQTPSAAILRWALKRGVAVLPVLADSWRLTGLKARVNAFLLARALNDSRIPVVANHNLPACLSLEKIGVDGRKIYPWDWPHAFTPEDYFPKTLSASRTPNIVSVGSMIEAKGARDCLEAADILRSAGVEFSMTLIGAGEFERPARALVAARGLETVAEIAGRRSHDEVIAALTGATISIVASHHGYAEGLPMTIYESLATRTPLVLSDHPMFQRFFAAAPSVRMVPQKSPAAIAQAIRSLLDDPGGYERASVETLPLWKTIKGDLVWGRLIEACLDDADDPKRFLPGCSLPERLAAQKNS